MLKMKLANLIARYGNIVIDLITEYGNILIDLIAKLVTIW